LRRGAARHALRPRRPDRLRGDDRGRGRDPHLGRAARRERGGDRLRGVGLAAINGAAIAGAGRIIAIDTSAAKDNLARTFGATDFIRAGETDPVKEVMEMTKGGVHHSFEAIGLSKTAEQAFNMLRRGGTANVIGMIPVGEKISLMGAAFLGEKRIQGSAMGSNRFPIDMPRLVDFYMSGKLKLDEMISRRLKLEEVNSAFDEMNRGEVARSVIVFDA
jgi:S-(hydroxymethyl)glutathione dehydrogenase/alcohol dehydrogenase